MIEFLSATNLAHGIRLSSTVEAAEEFHGVIEHAVDFAEWTIVSGDGVTGSVTVDIWVTTDGSKPTNSDSITNGNEPSMTSDTHATGTTSGFSSTEFEAGARVAVVIDSLTTMTELYFTLKG